MIAGIIIFLLGASVGGCAVAINDRIVEYRISDLEKENRRLREKIHRDRVEYESSRSYHKGYIEGRRNKLVSDDKKQGGLSNGEGVQDEGKNEKNDR